MERKIIGFHQDDRGDWVAELDCLHRQHTRHKPPFFNRPWVMTKSGRDEQIGNNLACPLCDRLEFPEGLVEFRRTPVFDQDSFPVGVQRQHSTKPSMWAKIHVLTGSLTYNRTNAGNPGEQTSIVVGAGESAAIAPGIEHYVTPNGNVTFYLAFYQPSK